MSTASEVDHIGEEAGKFFRQIIDAAHLFKHRRGGHRPRSHKGSRRYRKHLAASLRQQFGEQRITEAWYTKRALDFQAEAKQALVRQHRHMGDPTVVGPDQERLERIRFAIESTLSSTNLSPERRGQIVLTLDAVSRNPYTRFNTVFPPMDHLTAHHAREAARRSATWVEAQTAATQRRYAQHQQQLAQRALDRRRRSTTRSTAPARDGKRTQPSRTRPARSVGNGQPTHTRAATPPARTVTAPPGTTTNGHHRRPTTPVAEAVASSTATVEAMRSMTMAQIDAVQAIRVAERRWLDSSAGANRAQLHDLSAARTNAFDAGCQAGLSNEQMQWERDNIDANSRCRVAFEGRRHDSEFHGHSAYEGLFASEAEAAIWAERRLLTHDWVPRVEFRITAQEAGHDRAFKTIRGGEAKVTAGVRRWINQTTRDRDGHQHRNGATHGPDRRRSPSAPDTVASTNRRRGRSRV
ncbi:hypothetical protein [Nocardia transvalensis]|uniref:hypothetical protein n=1 Tax=Nocardia transvalensis TaxID=37333 RepID=UPI0018936220|nr:hypothetical protein [Nocardia transvalensis]MBF6333652.1 hypothetical protein [Nocardia transvalensis]